MSFEELGLSSEVLRAVVEEGYETPTPIQQKAIPLVLAGKDVMASAQTGTGKTAGFTLPLLQRLSQTPIDTSTKGRKGMPPVRALVLTPTRELAAQIAESVANYGKYLNFRSAVIFGGVSINPQISQLRKGVDILIATPGRLLDHANQGTVDLSRVEILVLDEADRMLDMGFIHDVKRVLALLPETEYRQNLLFSATFSKEIKQLATRMLNDPQLVEVAPQNATADRIEQQVHMVDKVRKRELLSKLIHDEQWQQVLVFTRTKHGANRLAEQLERDGLSAAAIHGNKSQGARTRALAGFKAGEVRVLVATDIAARGLDIDMLPNVVNFELPNVPEDYVHRIGRTARAGMSGKAVSLVCIDEVKLLKDIERLINRELPRVALEGFEPDPTIKAEPIRQGRQQGPRQGGGRGAGGGGGGPQGRSQGRSGNRSSAGGNNAANGQAASRNRRSRSRAPSGRTA
ncbi:DEAD/DEAH box helicase [Granulosicoccus antarcticus]|uniref:ATP-dependent RNA helicase RhlE n=1 Tax=Granulosicoccus antarcticus IMCC3135 TaxID=1192854 RepID=A0A2Z2NZP0_9GAMM|nr:DEAD/DEAH box helicase [Granulosicoccus antarcticus]ASJ72594.1 ATP-dependent RNA helicase RhlE [Granulosicoccus antarcticus IMCC3135]